MQLLVTLTNEPQPVATVAKRLRMTKAQLAQVINQNYAALEAHGMRLYGAHHSSTAAHAITLPSMADSAAPAYYSRISKEHPRDA